MFTLDPLGSNLTVVYELCITERIFVGDYTNQILLIEEAALLFH